MDNIEAISDKAGAETVAKGTPDKKARLSWRDIAGLDLGLDPALERKLGTWVTVLLPTSAFLMAGLRLGAGDNWLQNITMWAIVIGLQLHWYALSEMDTGIGWRKLRKGVAADYIRRAFRGSIILWVLWALYWYRLHEGIPLGILQGVVWVASLYTLYNAARGCLLRYKYLGYVVAACGMTVLLLGGVLLIKGML